MGEEISRRRMPCTTRKEFLRKLFIAESVPVFGAIPFAFLYFIATVPIAREEWRVFAAAILAVFLVTRIPNYLVITRVVGPPCFEWIERRSRGRVSQTELARYFVRLTRVVPGMQAQAAILWLVSGISIVVLVWWRLPSSAFTLINLGFTILLTAMIALSISYFTFQWLIRPFIEEVSSLLAETPTVGVFRVPLGLKVGGSVFAIGGLSFVAFGLLMWARTQTAFVEYALDINRLPAKTLAESLSDPARSGETDALLRAFSDEARLCCLLDRTGASLSPVNQDFADKHMAKVAKAVAQKPQEQTRRLLLGGPVDFYPVRGGEAFLVVFPNPEAVQFVVHGLMVATTIFLSCIILLLGSYIFWMSREIARLMKLSERFSRRLADGDLTEAPAVWSDDELGTLMDNLRASFRGLVRVAREMRSASASVDEEAARLSAASGDMASSVAEQTGLAQEAERMARESGSGAQDTAISMEKVASATQDVSSTILEMQASVEEIVGTAATLGASVEATVSSVNEIATTAEEVRSATELLKRSGHDAVSFLTELDASLSETREGSAQLAKLSGQVTQQAEGGFSKVAAVEEEVLRTLRVSEDSHRALGDLQTSLEDIGRILDVIQDITEQTNLLALNASIIAAGAGEHGRSFSVVAAQIRDLSAKTRVRAGEIRKVIGSLQSGGAEIAGAVEKVFAMVDRSATLSREAGSSLRAILESASSQEEMAKRIASAAEELAHGGQAASRTMHGIFERIEAISGSMTEQAKSTRLLTREAGKVQEVALQLNHAAEEQSRGAQMIAHAASDISRDAQQTTEVVHSQAARSAATAEAMQEIVSRAQETQGAFELLALASGRLRESASALEREVGRFRIPGA